MLTYEYCCRACEEEFLVEQSIKDDSFVSCPFCEGGSVYRLISGGRGFALKGRGWHSDLYSKPTEKINEPKDG